LVVLIDEITIWLENFFMKQFVLGIDEVGRGALAGPVYLAGVLLDERYPLHTLWYAISNEDLDESGFYAKHPEFSLIRDSKKLSSKKREQVSDLIHEKQFPFLHLQASGVSIDTFGIGVCLSHLLVMIISLFQPASLIDGRIIVDGKITVLSDINEHVLAKLCEENGLDFNTTKMGIVQTLADSRITIDRENFADDRYLSVALASNLAKVKRDLLMTEIGEEYPEFNWQQNKGYGSFQHRTAIQQNPNNPYLRTTFLRKILST
jgi:ribonuclease HII